MAVNGLGNYGVSPANYGNTPILPENTNAVKEEIMEAAGNEAAVFEKSEDTEQVKDKAVKPANPELIEKMKADAEARNAQLRGIVEKLLLKQGGTIMNAEGLASMYRRLEVDEETRRQAQEDISENGYWGVEATSDRIVDFAKAMAGDDLDMANKMLDAVKEGFKQAGEEWGEELPDISQQTMDATYKKLNEWIKSLGGTPADEAAEKTAEAE